jgi:hypothetical protein
MSTDTFNADRYTAWECQQYIDGELIKEQQRINAACGTETVEDKAAFARVMDPTTTILKERIMASKNFNLRELTYGSDHDHYEGEDNGE